MVRVGIINYDLGNIGSIKRKFDLLGITSGVISSYKEFKYFDKLVLPGVGQFASGVQNLKKLMIWDELNESVLIKKKQILGICLGMQLMAKHGDEGDVDGLGWFDADVRKFSVSDRLKFKIPHIGWNTLKVEKEHPVMNKIAFEDEFYFVHSYHINMNNNDEILASTIYDYTFTSAISRDNIFGFQFHPEKSLDTGKLLLKSFVEL